MERLTIDEAIKQAREVAKKNREAEALFLRDDCIWNAKQENKLAEKHEKLADWLEKLKEYEQAEEDGLLIRLPCKVGDTVFFLWRCSDETTIVHQATVKEICIGTYMLRKSIKYRIEPKGNCGMIKMFYSSDWGYDIFTTKAEAEQALAKMKGE